MADAPPASVRPFRESDLPKLQQIRRAAFAPVFASFREILGETIYGHALADADAEQAVLLADLCEAANPAIMLVAEIDGEIVGFVSYTIREGRPFGEIGLNAVDPAVAGRGIGTWLYRATLGRMKEAGVKVVEVGTGGDPSHAPARRAYEKAGFTRSIPSVAMYCEL